MPLVRQCLKPTTDTQSYLHVYAADYLPYLTDLESRSRPSLYLHSGGPPPASPSAPEAGGDPATSSPLPTASAATALHPELTQSMRGILVDWLVELSTEYSLSPPTLYHAVSLVDRSLTKLPPVPRSQLQCLGCACTLIAAKLHEIHPPTADDFVYISDSTYTRAQITGMESRVCAALEFRLSAVTPESYLETYALAARLPEHGIDVYRYILELTLLDYRYLQHSPSLISAGALCVALASLRLPWTQECTHYSGRTVGELRGVVKQILASMWGAEESSLKTVFGKWKTKKVGEVALKTVPRWEEFDWMGC
ncbi:hypothetical protein TeGR_g14314 [Tetraparma gracilis]|uniref:Cyclin-like protein n=1 Tax=Tetraparma gracilis TaxID=2962635 RepID=A0ABQ6NA69_9STRA|nr:hypothetical protein TeGR_g14314 [Tetraparma gracilis]